MAVLWIIFEGPGVKSFLEAEDAAKAASCFAFLALSLLCLQAHIVRWKILRRTQNLPDRLIPPALVVHKKRITREVNSEMKRRMALWEIEKEDWKYEKSSELYEQIMSQAERGALCGRCRNTSGDH